MSFWVRDKGFYRNLLLLAIPIILQNFIMYGVVLADNLMVGQMGETSILGLYFGSRIHLVLQILLFGMESTSVILAAQYWGKRDLGHIKDVVSIVVRIAFGFSLLVAAAVALWPCALMHTMTDQPDVVSAGAGYLRHVAPSYVFFAVTMMLIAAMRSVEMVRIGLINSIAALIVNCTGNYALIYGHFGCPAMGVEGAAVATDISRIAEFLLVLFFVLRVDRNLQFRLRDFGRWNKDIFHDILKYGIPLMSGQVVWAINQYVRPVVIGGMAQEASSAVSICDTYDTFLCIGAFGLSAAVGIIVGKTIGRGDLEQVKLQAKTMQVVFLVYGCLCSLVAFCFSEMFLRCYNINEGTIAMARQLMLVLYVVVIGRCYQAPSLMGLVKAGGDTHFVFRNDTIFVFCVVLPSAIIAQFVCHAPAWIVYSCLLSDQILKCFVAVVKINRFNWMKKVTRPAEES